MPELLWAVSPQPEVSLQARLSVRFSPPGPSWRVLHPVQVLRPVLQSGWVSPASAARPPAEARPAWASAARQWAVA
jgi:hypothetical protein